MKRLGLVGGTSWVSSEHYYRILNEGVAARVGGSASAPVTLWSLEFGEFARLQHASEWDGVARILADAARRLVDAGCEGIALAANTPHLRSDDVRAAIGDVPFLDLVELTADAVAGYRRVGLLGTRFTMTSALFPDRFAARGVEVVVPGDDEQQRVHELIYDELTRGVVSEQARADYLVAIDKLVAEGAEAVVLACTEQGLLLHDGDAAVPLIDTTEVHCRALLEFILEGSDA
ncbi:MAG TPA: aspartate/glutamate racemase family protein [Jatrophihabitantaceae bacterium]|jgi:aspartate racemase|nr:aspartate/glutamate racemase family protein [Jatrophihabitantaceae bacterium]